MIPSDARALIELVRSQTSVADKLRRRVGSIVPQLENKGIPSKSIGKIVAAYNEVADDIEANLIARIEHEYIYNG